MKSIITNSQSEPFTKRFVCFSQIDVACNRGGEALWSMYHIVKWLQGVVLYRTRMYYYLHRYVLKWIRVKRERAARSGAFTSFCYWPPEKTWPNQNSVFQKCELVVCARLGSLIDVCGMCIKQPWLVWLHQAWLYAKHIEKKFYR